MEPQKPSVGRIVHYVSHGSPVGPDGTQAQYPVEFDGHSTAEKYERVRAFTDPTTSRDA